MSDSRLKPSFNSSVSELEVTQFCEAAKAGDVTMLRSFLDKFGAGIIDRRDGSGDTALSWAAWTGQKDAVVLLLDRGADTEVKGAQEKTALIWAAESNKQDIVALLVERGADTDARDQQNLTALEEAMSRGYNDIVDTLQQGVVLREKKAAERRAQEEIVKVTQEGLKLAEVRRDRLKQIKPPKLKIMPRK